MAREPTPPIGAFLKKNRSLVEKTRAQIAESKALCSTSRNLIKRIARLQEFINQNLPVSRIRTPESARDDAARGDPQAEREPPKSSQSIAAGSLAKSSRGTKKAGLHFLRTEISAGRTFTAIAESKSREEGARTRAHARAACDAVGHFTDQVDLTPAERKEVLRALNGLKLRLRALGELF